MSSQISASRIESKIPASELMIGELQEWDCGICTVVGFKHGKTVPGGLEVAPTLLKVYGENGHPIESINVVGETVEQIKRIISSAIAREMGQL